MAKNEKTSKKVASIAAKGLKDPKSLTASEIKALAASALTQAPDKAKKTTAMKKPAKKKAAKKKPEKKKVEKKKAAKKKA